MALSGYGDLKKFPYGGTRTARQQDTRRFFWRGQQAATIDNAQLGSVCHGGIFISQKCTPLLRSPDKRGVLHMDQVTNDAKLEPSLVFLSKAQVLKKVPVTAPTLWAWVRAGKFPKPRDISP